MMPAGLLRQYQGHADTPWKTMPLPSDGADIWQRSLRQPRTAFRWRTDRPAGLRVVQGHCAAVPDTPPRRLAGPTIEATSARSRGSNKRRQILRCWRVQANFELQSRGPPIE